MKKQVIVSTISMAVMMIFSTSVFAKIQVESVYENSCATCHSNQAFDSPQKGDTATWQMLLKQKDMADLVQSVKGGLKQMPAGGMCDQCTDKDYQLLIEYMMGEK